MQRNDRICEDSGGCFAPPDLASRRDLLGTKAGGNKMHGTFYEYFRNTTLNANSFFNNLYNTAGGTLLGNYSWSKFLGDSEGVNPPGVETHTVGVIQDYTNLRAEKSYLSFDVPQHLVISYILDLPFGRGKRFLGNAGGGLDRAIGGWNISGINTFQSGFPLALSAPPNAVSAAFGGGTPRPNYTPGCNQKASVRYVAAAQAQTSTLNSACFSTPSDSGIAAHYFGNQPRTSGTLRSQGIDNWDFSLGKQTPLREDLNLVFRAEAFNVINRVQFNDPGLTYGTPTFGVLTTQANLPRTFQFSLGLNY